MQESAIPSRRRIDRLAPAYWPVFALLAWSLMLTISGKMPFVGNLILIVEAGLLLAFCRQLSPAAERNTVALIFLIALLAFTTQILVIQSLAYYSGRGVTDTQIYHLQAQALVRHWAGETVPAHAFRLIGLEAIGVTEWKPDAPFSYHTALGYGRDGYQFIVAAIYWLTGESVRTAIFFNAAFLAGTAAATYLLALGLFGLPPVALFAAILVMLDTDLAIHSAYLLRDGMLVFTVVLSLTAAVRLYRRQGHWFGSLVLLTATILALPLLRLNALAAMIVSASLVALFVGRKHLLGTPGLLLAATMLAGFAAIHWNPAAQGLWRNSLPEKMVTENLEILKSGIQTLRLSASENPPDLSGQLGRPRLVWFNALRDRPLWLNLGEALVKSFVLARPWHFVKPGTAIWLISLPFFFFALWRLICRGDPAVLYCLGWAAVATVIYIIGYGEFAGRPQTMAHPLGWICVAWGAAHLRYGKGLVQRISRLTPPIRPVAQAS